MDRQIVTAQEMRQLDRLTLETRNISSYDLMELAASACANYSLDNHLYDASGRIVVLAGPGNNGGDAVVMYRHMLEQHTNIVLLQIGSKADYSEELHQAHSSLPSVAEVIYVKEVDDVPKAIEFIDQATTIIDGIFGIGLLREVTGIYKQMIDAVNQSYASTISIDIPSGIQANNGLVLGVAIQATHTLVIQNYKQGNLLNDGLDFCGTLHLIDVGILQTIFPEEQVVLDKNYLHNKIPRRRQNSYKYMYGNVLTIGGSKGMMGAPVLAAYASLKMGSGLSHVLHYEKHQSGAFLIYPDLMMDFYQGIEEIPSLVRNKSAIVFGPGLGKQDNVNLNVLQYLLETDIPLLIDADGIHYLKHLLKDYSSRENIIITPHFKELSDFLGVPIEDVKKEPILYAKNIAHTYNLTVVLKGACTIITNNTQTFFSIHGNPGLATAGTGDVLAGMIGNLLGRGMPPMEAAKLGVLFHSHAGQYAKELHGEESMIASDLIDVIPEVMRHARR